MNKLAILVILSTLFIFSSLSQAVDVKLEAIADGTNNQLGNYRDGTSAYMWADGTSLSSNYRRRSVVKFDATSLRGRDVRGLDLNIWGFGSGGTAVVDIYHYANDNWSDSSVPYASSLGSKMASAQIAAGSSYYLNKCKQEIGLSNLPPYLGWYENQYLSMALVATGSNNAAFVTRNGVSWDGSAGKAPYLTIRTWEDSGVFGGTFGSSMGNWGVNGSGTAQLVANPYGADNAVQLTTGSPVSITQVLDTPENPFYLNFDYAFETETGWLDIMMTDRDGTEFMIGQLLAQDSTVGQASRASFHIRDAGLLYQDNVELEFQLDGVTGSQILLDNIEFSDVPEPATVVLLGLGAMSLIRRRK